MNRYLRFYSGAVGPSLSSQYVLVNVSKMTIIASAAGSNPNSFITTLYYGENKEYKLNLTFTVPAGTPDMADLRVSFVNFLGPYIEQVCEQGSNNVFIDVSFTDNDGFINIRNKANNSIVPCLLFDVTRTT